MIYNLLSRRNLLLGTFIKGGFVNDLPEGFEEFLRGDDESRMEMALPQSSFPVPEWSTPFITEECDPTTFILESSDDRVNDESSSVDEGSDDGSSDNDKTN